MNMIDDEKLKSLLKDSLNQAPSGPDDEYGQIMERIHRQKKPEPWLRYGKWAALFLLTLSTTLIYVRRNNVENMQVLKVPTENAATTLQDSEEVSSEPVETDYVVAFDLSIDTFDLEEVSYDYNR